MYSCGPRMSPGNRTQSRRCPRAGRQQSCARQGKRTGHHRGLRAGHGFKRVNRELGRASRLLGSNGRSKGDRRKQHPGVWRPTQPRGEPTLAQAGRDTKDSASTQGTGREATSGPTGMDEGSRSNAQYRGAGDIPCPDAWGTKAQGTHDKGRKAAGRQCRAWRRCQGKGRRDFEPANCLNETGIDCTKHRVQGFALGRAATAMSPCGLVNCKVNGPHRTITDEPYE
jgi:hypothetical protein